MKSSQLMIPAAAALLATAISAQDFNGDGREDLAIGVPFEDVNGVADAGAVHVLFGGSSGVTSTGDLLITMQPPYYFDWLDIGDRYGSALAWGDFDADGYDDLAVGAPGKDAGGVADSGEVVVLYGGPGGFVDWEYWDLSKPYVLGTASARDHFGFALAAGDFDGDGYADLAVGAPYADSGAVLDTGTVSIFYGTSFGLHDTGQQHLFQPAGEAEPSDLFGYSLAAGRFNGDGYADLAVSAILENVGGVTYAGAVWELDGSAAGLAQSSNWQQWHQDVGSIQGGVEMSDEFGVALAAGDFDGDGYQDLAVGVPYEDIGAVQNAGAIHVIRGGAAGLTDAGNQLFYQGGNGVLDSAETGDLFGSSLAAGRFGSGGYVDLAIGVPLEDVGSQADAGAFAVLYGGRGGLTTTIQHLFTQNANTMLERAEAGDRFGFYVGAADFNGNGYDDIAVAAPYEDLNGVVDAGGLHVFYSASGGVSLSGLQVWSQNSAGVLDACESNDRFGAGLIP